MEISAIALYGAIATASCAAVAAIVFDRFRRVTAGAFALMGGIAPWLFVLEERNCIPHTTLIYLFGHFGAGPLFLVAFFLYRVDQHTLPRNMASGTSVVGIIAGTAYSLILFSVLSRME